MIEREILARQRILTAFDRICPGVVGNRWQPHWPTPQQQLFLGLHLQRGGGETVFEALYGGAASGGKSDCLLMSVAQFANDPEFAALVIRKTFQDLNLPGAIMSRAVEWWRPRGAHWDGTNHLLTFPSGARVQFGYLQTKTDHLRYKSSEFHETAWDELTEIEIESQYRFVGLSRVRRAATCRIPLRTLSASNPGGPGHAWVRKRFVGDASSGVLPELRNRFVRARVRDNPHVDRDAYVKSLSMLHPTVRDQLLNGDWSARDPGDYFRSEWFGPLLDPATDRWPDRDCIRIRWWDLAASESEDAARTAGVLMARHRSGVRAIEHCRSFRATPGKRDDLIAQVAATDGHGVVIGLEIEGGSGGPAQFEYLSSRLRSQGFRVVGARPRVGDPEQSERERAYLTRATTSEIGKAGRADPVASCLERGYQRRGECPNTGGPWWGLDQQLALDQQRDGIRLFAGPWTRDYLDVVESFPDGATCDEVDATSGAWAWLEAHPFGRIEPIAPPAAPRGPAQMQDLHPVDRDELEAEQATRRYRW